MGMKNWGGGGLRGVGGVCGGDGTGGGVGVGRRRYVAHVGTGGSWHAPPSPPPPPPRAPTHPSVQPPNQPPTTNRQEKTTHRVDRVRQERRPLRDRPRQDGGRGAGEGPVPQEQLPRHGAVGGWVPVVHSAERKVPVPDEGCEGCVGGEGGRRREGAMGGGRQGGVGGGWEGQGAQRGRGAACEGARWGVGRECRAGPLQQARARS